MKPSSCEALGLAAILLIALSSAADPAIDFEKAKSYFAEAGLLCKDDGERLWGVSLCGPMMFVDPASRLIAANQADAHGLLRPVAGVFTGILPADVNAANSSVEWSGVRWTQILWPLPEEAPNRKLLIAHESFHRIQKQLGMWRDVAPEHTNEHLDTKEGRYYMQLEWKALARALQAENEHDRKEAICDALLFRSERYNRFPDAEVSERELELNEGLAEYTAVKIAPLTEFDQIQAAVRDLSKHVLDPTFVRSFAYATGPAYGLLLDQYSPGWRKRIGNGSQSLPALLKQALAINEPSDLHKLADKRSAAYGGPDLWMLETIRAFERKQLLSEYKARFVDGPVLALPMQHKSLQFDPRNVQPLGRHGTIYPTLRIASEWGVLESTKGALLSMDGTVVSVVAPTAPASSTVTSTVTGEGWILCLNPGWKIVAAERKGSFTIMVAH